MMNIDKDEFNDLDSFFDAAKKQDDIPSSALFDAVLADANTQYEDALIVAPIVKTKVPFWKQIDFVQTWKFGLSFATVACLGLFIGYSAPDTVLAVGNFTADTDLNMFSSDTVLGVFDEFLLEG
jgi:hypothetical protein